MRSYTPGNDDAGPSAARRTESRDLDVALGAMGSKFSHGYATRLASLDDAICDFVDGLRSDDIDAAHVLIRLKEHLASAPFSSDVDAFAVRRCIARYYERAG